MAALGARPIRILHVDDRPEGRDIKSRILRQAHFQVSEAVTGEEALRVARQQKPDVVLLDVNLPDVSGFEVCRLLKSDPETARIPVLQLGTANMRSQDRERGFESGADSFLAEPVEPEELIATIRFVLRSRQAELAMDEMARQWETTFHAITDGVALLDAEGRIVRVNQALLRILQQTETEIIGTLCYDLWGSTTEASTLVFPRMLRSRQREEMEIRYSGRCLRAIADPVLDAGGAVTGAVYIVADETDRRRLEAEIRQEQKLESIGHLAAGVAHDFNNLLTSIMGNTSLVLSDSLLEPDSRERLEEVIRASERAAHLTQQLLAYSGKTNFALRPVNLSRLVIEMADLLQASVPKKIRVILEVEPALPLVDADVSQFQQAVMNLVLNAAEAIGDSAGTITIATGPQRIGNDEISELAAGPHVFLEVRDTGCGMDEATRAQMFDPFFTTKFTGRGLGLSAVAGIVRGHKGSIQVASAPGVGSTFRILLPQAEPVPVTAPETRSVESSTVLVVDDEDMVRRIARASLETRGYKVLLAENGEEAVNLVRKHGEEISLVVLDLMMPVLGGQEALDLLYRIRPGLKVIVSTGYNEREALRLVPQGDVVGFLRKPYTARQLGDKVSAALSKRRIAKS